MIVFFEEVIPAIVVGVVGGNHVPGIKNYWNKELDMIEINRLLK